MSIDTLLSLPWKQYHGLRIPRIALMSLDDLSLYAVVPLNDDGDPLWNDAVLRTDWRPVWASYVEAVNAHLASIAENGKVAYIESGRDCDCVEYSGRVHIVDATYEAFEKLDEDIGEWADGPYTLSLCRVSETRGVRYESRDLVLEAYENGHPHHIVSRFP